MKKVLITGPTGAVGVSLINEMIENGIQITAVCRPNSKRRNAIPNHELVEVVECGLDSLNSLQDRLMHDYDVFYHFAWDGTYGESRQDLYLQTKNIIYTLDAVHLAAALG